MTERAPAAKAPLMTHAPDLAPLAPGPGGVPPAPRPAAREGPAPPPPPPADPLAHPAYVWREGVLVATRAFRPLALDLLTGIEAQKAQVLANSRRLADGLPAHDVLLWGARGTGKSSLVKSVVGALQAEGKDIALVEVAPDALHTLPHLFDQIADSPRAFALFV